MQPIRTRTAPGATDVVASGAAASDGWRAA